MDRIIALCLIVFFISCHSEVAPTISINQSVPGLSKSYASDSIPLSQVAELWKSHYAKRLKDCKVETVSGSNGVYEKSFICSPMLREGNCPRIYYHGKKTDHVLVLTHGLSDSPWYVHFIAEVFYKEGFNVVMPLLPAHGLKEPNDAMKDSEMSVKWQAEMDATVEVAGHLGKEISIGGFSTGGTLGYNKILRDPEMINGGLFLFSGALNIGSLIQFLGRIGLVGKLIKWKDGKIYSEGPDPYKYGKFPYYGAFQLAKINNENSRLQKKVKVVNPILSAHSIHDNTADIQGVLDLLRDHEYDGASHIIGSHVEHAELPLKIDVPIDKSKIVGDYFKPPLANPQFGLMMEDCMAFCKKYIL